LPKFFCTAKRARSIWARWERKRFLTVATLGFDSHVSRFVEHNKLWVKGQLAYLYGIARILPGYEFPRVRLSGDFGVIDEELFLAATGNTANYGGNIPIVPDARLDSGVFEIVWFANFRAGMC